MDIIMKNIEIFDPEMCCSTGVCGPSVDAELMRMATIINALAKTKEYPTNEELSKWLNIEIRTKQTVKKGGCGCGTKGCC